MIPIHEISGIILAAGASERMGLPKANLEYTDGTTVLEIQVKTLSAAGIKDIYVVTGAHTSEIKKLNFGLDVKWVENPKWQAGQFSSVQAGIEAALGGGNEGAIILPVDAANIAHGTVTAIITTALANPQLDAVIPEYAGRRGHPVYVSAAFMELIACKNLNDPDSRLDTILKNAKQRMILPVSDANIVNNLNSPEDWERSLCE